MAEKVKVTCTLCEKEVLGRAIMLINDSPEALRPVWNHDAVNRFSNGIEYMVLHPMCFETLWQRVCEGEVNVALTLCFGTLDDLVRGMYEDTEGETDGE